MIDVKPENKQKFEENVRNLINDRNKNDLPQTYSTIKEENQNQEQTNYNHLLHTFVSNNNLRLFSKHRSKGPVTKVNNKLSSK